jgi:hypothetical protein
MCYTCISREGLIKTTTSVTRDSGPAEIGTEDLPDTSTEILRFSNPLSRKNRKVKAILVTGHADPYGCETSRLPRFLDSRLTDGGKVVSLTRRPPFAFPGTLLVLISVRG